MRRRLCLQIELILDQLLEVDQIIMDHEWCSSLRTALRVRNVLRITTATTPSLLPLTYEYSLLHRDSATADLAYETLLSID